MEQNFPPSERAPQIPALGDLEDLKIPYLPGISKPAECPVRQPSTQGQSIEGTVRSPHAVKIESYDDFLATLRNGIAYRKDLRIEKIADLNYHADGKPANYEMLRISSQEINPGEPVLLIRGGIHGNEAAGSLTLMKHIDAIFTYAHQRGVKLIVYPLDNPSGYEYGLRYNVDNETGNGGNNDFLRYELKDGRIAGDIGEGVDPLTGVPFEIKRILWSSDPALNINLPQETAALHRDLKAQPISQVQAVLDLHGDNYLTKPLTYQYTYGEKGCYRPIISRVRSACEILADCKVEEYPDRPAGYQPEIFKVLDDPQRPHLERADADGFILHHDGAFTDLFHRLGVPHCITIEMSGVTPQATSDRVHLAWIEGLVDLLGQGPASPSSNQL